MPGEVSRNMPAADLDDGEYEALRAIGLLAEDRGRLVRGVWIDWARRQPNPKPSWLIGWDDLDQGQREVDILIGEEVARAERERIHKRLSERWPGTSADAIDALIGP